MTEELKDFAGQAFSRSVVTWYRAGHRQLPWRETRDPYLIWLSEVMLQQTQAATVIPYFEAFREAYPDVYSLAAASDQEVLKAWQGLGYYAR
ncbi:MAG: hypothetical protein KC561_10725, partial [Myxococcales bacterium]|nr:hypothetical protein [Myxococcales bacterium]